MAGLEKKTSVEGEESNQRVQMKESGALFRAQSVKEGGKPLECRCRRIRQKRRAQVGEVAGMKLQKNQ